MQDMVLPKSLGQLPAQLPDAPQSAPAARARFFNSNNAFMIDLSPVPDMAFVDQPARALSKSTETGLIACDISAELECDFPATAPMVMAYYARIRAGESLVTDFVASGTVFYVIEGTGTTASDGESVAWSAGDIFIAPGGVAQSHVAVATEDAVLWIVNNEPLLAHERVRAPAPEAAPTRLVHYPAAEIERQLDLIYAIGFDDDTAGASIIFSSEQQEHTRNILPTLTLGYNTLPPGGSQRAHRHNSVAVALIIQGEKSYSMIDGTRKDWTPWATTITPPTSVHAHYNDGAERARFLIVQDGGLYYHARANGFEFVDDAT